MDIASQLTEQMKAQMVDLGRRPRKREPQRRVVVIQAKDLPAPQPEGRGRGWRRAQGMLK